MVTAVSRPQIAWVAALFGLLPLLLTGCGDTAGDAVLDLAPFQERALATAHTTRLPAGDPETQAIVIAQAVYAATREENAVGAIILARQDAAEAFTAMHRITHMPINAPLLYLDSDGLPSEAVLREMRRLRPDGVPFDGKTQVYVVGRVDEQVRHIVEDQLNYKVRVLRADDPVALAELLDAWQAAVKADHPDEVVISAIDHPDGMAHGIGAMGWNAHMGRGFAWVYRNAVPEATRRILNRRYGDGGAYIYLTGGPEVISDEVARELSQYGLVRRIHGPTVFESNTVNAGYKDFGRDFGWWWGWEPRDFGWGISQAGHNFIVGSRDDLLGLIPAAVLGHMGKHGPLLLVGSNEVPDAVTDYLEMVRPFPSGPTHSIFNHAWIIGDEARVAWPVQQAIDRLLRPSGMAPESLQLQAQAGGEP